MIGKLRTANLPAAIGITTRVVVDGETIRSS
jgi:hypothetical protein